MNSSNVHTPDDFQRDYGTRTWTWYEPLLHTCLAYGLQEPILDLGCGLGLFVECCTHRGLRCVGLEGSDYGVQQALARVPMLDIRQHDLSIPLPFPDESFGSVILHQVIEHLEPAGARAVLHESRRTLVTGGCLFIFSPSRYHPEQRTEPTHTNLYTPRQLIREVRRAGFSRVQSLNHVLEVGGVPIYYLGYSDWGKRLVNILHRYLRCGFLSAAANCVAVK